MAGPPPLQGLRVLEFSHMVMGPAAGLVFADLGADVIKIEPLEGDNTRRLRGSGAGYFAMYNRNKRSLAVDFKTPQGAAIVRRLAAGADVFIENFRPGALEKYGFGYQALAGLNPRLVYCSEKGFLDGPYAHRTALDEVAQMMGGLAYMTGPPGRPLRAGASVIDVTAGLFGAIAILAALEQRRATGRGCQVSSALFETTAFLVGQHMAQYRVTGTPAPPMPARISAWAIYDVFDVADGEKVFIGVVTDAQWRSFCEAFNLADWARDPSLAANNDRVARREALLPRLQDLFAQMRKEDLLTRLDKAGLPFAPITRPEDLFADPHLNHGQGLLELRLPGGGSAALPNLPISLEGKRLDLRQDPPEIGEHSRAIAAELGYQEDEIAGLLAGRIIAAPPAQSR